MASTATHIPNLLTAVQTGAIPGAFSADRTEFAFPTLAYAGARGATHLWTIRVRLLQKGRAEYAPIEDGMLDQPAADLAGYKAEIRVEAQQQGGKIRDVVPTYVTTGKNLGKKNATNALTQAMRDALGLYNKQKRRADITEAPAAALDPSAAESFGPDEEDVEPRPVLGHLGSPGRGAQWVGPSVRPKRSAGPTRLGPPIRGPEGPKSPAMFDPMPPPMLVKKLGESREARLTPDSFLAGVTAQRKLNGVHFVAFARTGPGGRQSLIRYSRTGSEYPGQEQIVRELLPMVAGAPRIAPGQYGTPASPSSEQDRRVLDAYGALVEGVGPSGPLLGGPNSDRQPGSSEPAPYFAGELYLHGRSLNWISGQARRGDDDGLLEFHIFDVFFPHAKAAGHDMESRARQAYLDAFFSGAEAAGLPHNHVKRVENFAVHSLAELHDLAKRFLREGYEGAIARKDGAGYRYSYNGYHSANVLKIKPKQDAEFPVVGFTQGRRGKDVGAVIWICEVPHPVNPRDKTFHVVPKDMDYKERYALFQILGRLVPGPGRALISRFERDVEGLPLTVEFAELSTKTGKPLQAKALAFRTYEAGPEKDPIRQLLAEAAGGGD